MTRMSAVTSRARPPGSAEPGFRARTLERLQRYLGLHVICVVYRDLAQPGPPLDDGGFTFRRLAEDEVLALCPDPAWDIEPEMVREAFARGGTCVGAFRDGLLHGYGWYAYADTSYADGVRTVVPPGLAYRYKTFIHAGRRGRGLGRLLFLRGSEVARMPGREGAFGLVNLHNEASIAASVAAGFRPIGHIAYWRPGPFFLAWHAGPVRRLGLRLERDA
jgi:hypothetical protein